jgi:hypothetical protein
MLSNHLPSFHFTRLNLIASARRLLVSLATLCMLTLLASCGGSGGSSDAVSGGTGHFALTVGDNALDDFDQAIFDISKITVLGGDNGHVVVLDEMRSIDFLALETVNEILAELDIPAGDYNKLRLQVDKITLVELDDSENVIREIDAKRVANGKVDVLVKGGFTVLPGDNTILSIDIDLEKSIKLVSHNNTYHFRPVIFAKIVNRLDDGRLIRLAGEFEAIDNRSDAFKLCDIDLLSDSDEVPDSFDCRTVRVGKAVGVFSATELGLKNSAIIDFNNGDPIVVYGHLMRHDDDDDISIEPISHDDDDHEYKLGFNAVVVANGSFEILEGTATTEFDSNNETFSQLVDKDLEVTPDALGFTTQLALSKGAVLYDDQGQSVESATITAGTEIETEGLVIGKVDFIDAFIGIIKTGDAGVFIQGTLTSIDLGNLWLYIEDDTPETHCVVVNEDTVIHKLTQPGGVVISESVIDISTLLSGEFEVRGTLNGTECEITATSIVVIDAIETAI